MTTPNYRDDLGSTQTTGTGSSASSGAADQAKQAAGTAADQSKHVAGVAQGEARKVAGEAKSQLSGLVSQATSQVSDQSRTQRDRLVELLRSFGNDLSKMADQADGGPAATVSREVADRAHSLSSRLEGREPTELLDEVRDFARRKPGVFLLGALAAGVVAGRLTRGAKEAQSGTSSTSGASYDTYASTGTPPAGYGTAAGTPLAGTAVPQTDPVYPDDAVTGLPAPGQSVAAESTWRETRTPGGLT